MRSSSRVASAPALVLAFSSLLTLAVSQAEGSQRQRPTRPLRSDEQQTQIRSHAIRPADAASVVSITDPAGDTKLNFLFDDSTGAHAKVSGTTVTVTVPSWLLNDTQGFQWVAISADDFTDFKTTAPATWTAGTTSQLTSPTDSKLADWADILTASVQQPDPQHISFTITTRGPAVAATVYGFDAGNAEVVVYPITPDSGPQVSVFNPARFNRHPAAAYEDIVAATGENRNGSLHLTLTAAAPIPAIPR